MQVNDFGNDIILAEACRDDVDKFCSGVKSGGGKVHDCLREHRDQLSQARSAPHCTRMTTDAACDEWH
jgi:golgi apparatus protein 1